MAERLEREWRRVIQSDPVVHSGIETRERLEAIIIKLVAQKESLRKELADLRAITPKRIRGKDGNVYVWHCPDDMIPIQEVT